MLVDFESEECNADSVTDRLIGELDCVFELCLQEFRSGVAGFEAIDGKSCVRHGCFYSWSAAGYRLVVRAAWKLLNLRAAGEVVRLEESGWLSS